MNFSHLEYAMTVAECRSINKAAQRLLVSQPYLSGVLKNLEEELGCQLFKRSHNGILLTEKGIKFMDSARIILYEYEKLKQLSWDEAEQPMVISSYGVGCGRPYASWFHSLRRRKKGKIPEAGQGLPLFLRRAYDFHSAVCNGFQGASSL